MERIYDLIVLGAGPAGMTSSLYASRAMLDTLVIEKSKVGGQTTSTSEIVNYPGIDKISGADFGEKLKAQAENFNAEFVSSEVKSVELKNEIKTVTTSDGTYKAYSIIIATGAQASKIGFKGEDEFTGRGIAYCATCDGEFFTDLDVFVIGGGFAAAEEAVFLTRYARKVTIIIREPDFTCAKMVAKQALDNEKIEVIYNTEVVEVSGDGVLQKATFKNNVTNEIFTHEASEEDGTFGMFIFAGTKPATEMFKGVVNLDRNGCVVVDANMSTNVAGVYAAGDLVEKELRQVVTAVSDGAIAANSSQKYVAELKNKLNLPEISEYVMDKFKKPEAKRDEVSKSKETKQINSWFSDEIQEQLKGIFTKLDKNVELALFSNNDDKGKELEGFLKDFVNLSDKLSLNVYNYNDEKLREDYGIIRQPSFTILVNGKNTEIKFSGIPSGHELNSLVLAIYNTAGPGQEISPELKTRIESLKPAKIEVCVSLSCKYCPDVVAATQRIAALNNNISAEMIDISLYPDLKTKRKIMSVPALIINDGDDVTFGSKSLDEIITMLEQ